MEFFDSIKRKFLSMMVNVLNNENALIKFAEKIQYRDIRMIALKKITDQKVILRIGFNSYDSDFRKEVFSMITDEELLAEIATSATENTAYGIDVSIVNRIANEKLLVEIALNAELLELMMAATKKITDEKLLVKIAKKSKSLNIKTVAVQGITDEKNLLEFANKTKSLSIRRTAVENLKDQTILADFGINDEDWFIRKTARKKITDPHILANVIKNCRYTDEVMKLRSKHVVNLDESEVQDMIVKWNFYEHSFNPGGKGIDHEYEVQSDGNIIYDGATKLFWQRGGSKDHVSSENLRAYIKVLNDKSYAGYNNWRLPTLEEVMSLVQPPEVKNFVNLRLSIALI